MNVKQIAQLLTVTIALTIGLGASIAAAFRVDVTANWTAKRCEPGVIPIAGVFKPRDDPRTAAEFAADNFKECQKVYIQDALRAAADAPKELLAAESGVVGMMHDATDAVADVFYDLWRFCYEAYSSFMDSMKGAAKLFHNFMIQLHSIVERLQASVLSIVFGLISLIVAYINSVQLVLIVAIVIIGILIALQIILFFLLLPISGLIITITALISVVVVAVATAIAAATVAELFTPGVCFATGTQILMADGSTKPIEQLTVGAVLHGGARVTATHHFYSLDPLYELDGIHVTGDHLVYANGGCLIPVRDHPSARALGTPAWDWLCGGRDLWCLTTTNRTIPCVTTAPSGQRITMFADWEEIPEESHAQLAIWHNEVWRALNGTDGPRPTSRVLDAEAGLSPDCMVACQTWLGTREWRRLMDVRVGDTVYDGPDSVTRVVGRVTLAGDQSTDAVQLTSDLHGPQIVSMGSWRQEPSSGLWTPAVGHPVVELHPSRWEHLYTESGVFLISGGWRIRDASDVGLDSLRPLVDSVVLGSAVTEPKKDGSENHHI